MMSSFSLSIFWRCNGKKGTCLTSIISQRTVGEGDLDANQYKNYVKYTSNSCASVSFLYSESIYWLSTILQAQRMTVIQTLKVIQTFKEESSRKWGQR